MNILHLCQTRLIVATLKLPRKNYIKTSLLLFVLKNVVLENELTSFRGAAERSLCVRRAIIRMLHSLTD